MTNFSRLTLRKIGSGVTDPAPDVLLRIMRDIGTSCADAQPEIRRLLQQVIKITQLVTIITLVSCALHTLRAMNTAYKQCLGEVLAEKRQAANINRRQLSLMVDISRLTIRKIETGVTNPSLDVLLRITQGIGVSYAEVVKECEERLAALPEDELDSPYIL